VFACPRRFAALPARPTVGWLRSAGIHRITFIRFPACLFCLVCGAYIIVGVQGKNEQQQGFLDVSALAGHLLKDGTVYAILAGQRDVLFPDGLFSDLFPSGRGRPSVPAAVIASVIVLQALNNYSDREAIDALTYDLRWKSACGYPVDLPGFDPSTLVYWRKRLAASERPYRIFDAITAVVTQSSVIKCKNRRAIDSTVFDDAVARQDTVTQLMAQIRRVGRLVPGAGDLIPVLCTRLVALTGHGYDKVGKPNIAWDDQAAQQQLVSALVEDALALLGGLDIDKITDQGGVPAEAVALLALVAGQDVEPAQGSDGTDGRWRIARKVAPERVISTVDPEARHARKTTSRKQDGFKGHLVLEPNTGVITAVRVTKASGSESSDSLNGSELLAADTTITTPVEVLADAAYGSGAMLAALDTAGHTPIIKPWPVLPAVADGFTVDDFTRDGNTLTCPAGTCVTISKAGYANFGKSCRGCPVRDKCTNSKTAKVMRVSDHDLLQRAHRKRSKDPEFQETYRSKRPLVERGVAWMTRGARRLRYRGTTKNNAWLHARAAAINLQRLTRLGLNYQNGTWAVA
jgi:transposase